MKAQTLTKQVKSKKAASERARKEMDVLAKKLVDMEEAQHEAELAKVVKMANAVQQSSGAKKEELVNQIQLAKEIEAEIKSGRNELDELLADQSEDEDMADMMREYEELAVTDQMALNFKDADKNIITPNKTPVAQTNVAEAKEKKIAENDFDRIMAELG